MLTWLHTVLERVSLWRGSLKSQETCFLSPGLGGGGGGGSRRTFSPLKHSLGSLHLCRLGDLGGTGGRPMVLCWLVFPGPPISKFQISFPGLGWVKVGDSGMSYKLGPSFCDRSSMLSYRCIASRSSLKGMGRSVSLASSLWSVSAELSIAFYSCKQVFLDAGVSHSARPSFTAWQNRKNLCGGIINNDKLGYLMTYIRKCELLKVGRVLWAESNWIWRFRLV